MFFCRSSKNPNSDSKIYFIFLTHISVVRNFYQPLGYSKINQRKHSMEKLLNEKRESEQGEVGGRARRRKKCSLFACFFFVAKKTNFAFFDRKTRLLEKFVFSENFSIPFCSNSSMNRIVLSRNVFVNMIKTVNGKIVIKSSIHFPSTSKTMYCFSRNNHVKIGLSWTID